MKKEKIIIAGNWKMNKTPKEAEKFIEEIIPRVKNTKCQIEIYAPYIDLNVLMEKSENSKISVGAQNFHWESFGAYTGEISVDMLESIGVTNFLVGHSERKIYFNETDEIINKKIKKVIDKSDINIILCVGETLDQRENRKEKEIILSQIKNALNDVTRDVAHKIRIAYEPIWAIGTGKTATNEQANQMCGFIKMCVQDLFGIEIGNTIKVLYGGSVTPGNCREIILMPNIDGVLIGGSSLKLNDFCYIIEESDKILN